MSVVVFAEEATYFLGGDVTYDQDLLDAEQTDGVNKAPHEAIESLRMIKEFARSEDIVVLPAHDPKALGRLATGGIYRPSA